MVSAAGALRALVVAVCLTAGRADTLPPGWPFKDWSLECSPTQFVGGFKSFFFNDFALGTDMKMNIFCRELNQRREPRTVGRSACYETSQFRLGQQFDWRNYTFNCKWGDFVNGISSVWDADLRVRLLTLKCCQPENTYIDKRIGCNSVGPMAPLQTNYVHMKNPYEPIRGCPTDVLTGVQYSKHGIAFRYCPLKVRGGKYNIEVCHNRKTTKVADAEFYESKAAVLDEMKVVESEAWSEVETSWRLDCGGFKGIQKLFIKFERLPSRRRDIVIKALCAGQISDVQSASRVRFTRFVELTRFGVASGCRNTEVVQGILSQYSNNTRLVSLICADNANSEAVQSYPYTVTAYVGSPHVLFPPPDADNGFRDQLIQTVTFRLNNYADSHIEMEGLMTEYGYVDPARFENSTLIDEITGGIDAISVEPGKSLSESVAPDTAAVADVDTEDLRTLVEGDWSAAGDDFRFDCGAYRAVRNTDVRAELVDGDRADFAFRFECAEVIIEPQTALRMRITTFNKFSALQQKMGCAGDEAVQGVQAVWRDGNRFLSFICAEGSNAFVSERRQEDISLDPRRRSSRRRSSRRRTTRQAVPESSFVGFDGESLANVVGEEQFGTQAMTVDFGTFEYSDVPKFTESTLIDEVNGITESINPVAGKTAEDGVCEDGVKSRWFGSSACPSTCSDDCRAWQQGTAFGEFKSAVCQPKGELPAEKCLCKFAHPLGTCAFDAIPPEGCVCLCNKVCGAAPPPAAAGSTAGPMEEPCGLGIAYKWLVRPEGCADSIDCMTSCQSWQPGLQFGALITSECKVNEEEAPSGGVPAQPSCYCEYENGCETDSGDGGPTSAEGECNGGQLVRVFGYNHCPSDCDRRCSSWVPGLAFGAPLPAECKPTDDTELQDACHCVYESEDGTCERPTTMSPEMAAAAAAAAGESLSGSFGDVRVIERRRRQSGLIANDDLRVIATPGDGGAPHTQWLVIPTKALQLCPDAMCNCGNVCDNWDALAAEAAADGAGGGGGGIDGTFGHARIDD